MTDKRDGPYQYNSLDAFLRHSKEREEAYASGFNAGLERAESAKLRARIAELERVLNRTKATLEYVSGFTVKSGYIECHGDKCRQINCLSCGGDFAVSYEPNRIELSLAEIKSVLGKGE